MKKIFKRFVDIWKLDFLARFFVEEKKDNKTTILFWIFSSIILTFVVAISFFYLVYNASDKIISGIEEYIPDGASMQIIGGHLNVQNVEQPFVKEIKTNGRKNMTDKSFVVVIDTESQLYNASELDKYDGGIVVLRDYATVKNMLQSQKFLFSEMSDLKLSKDELINFFENKKAFSNGLMKLTLSLTVFVFIGIVFLRLIMSCWWAFMLLIMTRIADIQVSYVTSYKAVLNLYFIPTIALMVLWMFGVHVPLLTTIVFVTIFAVNIVWIKKQPKEIEYVTTKPKNNIKETTETVAVETEKNSDTKT